MTPQQLDEAYVMIRAGIAVADKLESTAAFHGDSVTVRYLAEYIERTLVPLEQRR